MSSLDALLRPLGRRVAAEPARALSQTAAAAPARAEPQSPTERRARTLTLTRELLDAHGFPRVAVEISERAKRRAGSCHYKAGRPYLIRLAAWLVERAAWPEVEDTIRHEVAHAIAGFEAGHGPAWQRAAVAVGAKPERCYGDKTKAARPPLRYAGTCGCPGKLFERTRWTRAMRAKHLLCPTCRRHIEWRDTAAQ